jgi:exodeoxyribonuclease VII large subunit
MSDINQHDVILLTRGGGSEEDLWTFNDVSIAQTLFNLTTPCVSAIGHERDTSISDLVADVSAITPTAAAELLTPDLTNTKVKIQHNYKTLKHLLTNQLNTYRQKLDITFHQLEKSHPKNAINQEKQQLNIQFNKLQALVNQKVQSIANELTLKQNNLKHYDFKINSKKSDLNLMFNNISNLISIKFEKGLSDCQNLSNKLNTLSPLSTLSRGYSITLKKNNKQVITSPKQVNLGEQLETIVDKGTIISNVTHVLPKSH